MVETVIPRRKPEIISQVMYRANFPRVPVSPGSLASRALRLALEVALVKVIPPIVPFFCETVGALGYCMMQSMLSGLDDSYNGEVMTSLFYIGHFALILIPKAENQKGRLVVTFSWNVWNTNLQKLILKESVINVKPLMTECPIVEESRANWIGKGVGDMGGCNR